MFIFGFGVNTFPSLPESIMATCSAVLTFESVDEILWCDHSNETSSAVLLHGTIYFSMFCELKGYLHSREKNKNYLSNPFTLKSAQPAIGALFYGAKVGGALFRRLSRIHALALPEKVLDRRLKSAENH